MTRTLIVAENLSLDGVMQAPGRPDEDERGGFTRGGWAAAAYAADPAAGGMQQAATADAPQPTVLLFGRRTYLDLMHQWLDVVGDGPFADSFRQRTKYVVSNALSDPLPYPRSERLAGAGVERVRTLRGEGEGTIQALGSGELVRALAAADLVDEYVLSVVPVVLGSGRRLFEGSAPELQVVSESRSATGITCTRYRVHR